jgi:hypothetical protein
MWVALLADLDVEQYEEPPDWVVFKGSAEAAAHATGSGLFRLEDGTAGALCVAGEWPALTYSPAHPFSVGE